MLIYSQNSKDPWCWVASIACAGWHRAQIDETRCCLPVAWNSEGGGASEESSGRCQELSEEKFGSACCSENRSRKTSFFKWLSRVRKEDYCWELLQSLLLEAGTDPAVQKCCRACCSELLQSRMFRAAAEPAVRTKLLQSLLYRAAIESAVQSCCRACGWELLQSVLFRLLGPIHIMFFASVGGYPSGSLQKGIPM